MLVEVFSEEELDATEESTFNREAAELFRDPIVGFSTNNVKTKEPEICFHEIRQAFAFDEEDDEQCSIPYVISCRS